MQATHLAFARGDAGPIRAALAARKPAPYEGAWATFLRNHDELTLDKLTESERQEVFAAFGPEEDMQLYGRGLRRRLPTMFGGDERRLRMAYSLQFALPGTPTLFYGEEIGMAENLAVGERLAVRTPMQWTGGPTAGFSTAPPTALHRPLPTDPRYAPDAVNVERQRTDPNSLLNWFERLIRRRKELPELGWGTCTVLDTGEASVLALRHEWRGSTIVTTHNLAARRTTARLKLADVAGDDAGRELRLVDLFEAAPPIRARSGRLSVALPAYGHRWFRVTR